MTGNVADLVFTSQGLASSPIVLWQRVTRPLQRLGRWGFSHVMLNLGGDLVLHSIPGSGVHVSRTRQEVQRAKVYALLRSPVSIDLAQMGTAFKRASFHVGKTYSVFPRSRRYWRRI